MSQNIECILIKLRGITAEVLDSGEGLNRLEELCEDVEALDNPPAVFPEFFALMERLRESDLGSPGPMVHTMERYIGAYEDLLEESVRTEPTNLTVWMVNRILNVLSSDRKRWLPLLQAVEAHPSALESVKSDARMFLESQEAE